MPLLALREAGAQPLPDAKSLLTIAESHAKRGRRGRRESLLMSLAFTLPLALAAAILDITVGYPDALFRLVRHPVVWIGSLIGGLEARLNRPGEPFAARRAAGLFALAFTLAAVGVAATLVTVALPRWPFGFALAALIASSLIARQSLDRHVRDVAAALETGGLAAGRFAVAKIVGRDPQALDEAGVARAALESLAENFSDGVVAPLLWITLGGLAGGALYKAINTADSMIGHKNERYLAFGWAAARLDDLVNLPASRLAALWLLAAACLTSGARPSAAWRAIRRDAGRHRSPNAGWPEAAMAGALGLKLAGPRVYGATLVEDAFMGEGRDAVTAADVRRGLQLYRAACAIETLVLGGFALLTWR